MIYIEKETIKFVIKFLAKGKKLFTFLNFPHFIIYDVIGGGGEVIEEQLCFLRNQKRIDC